VTMVDPVRSFLEGPTRATVAVNCPFVVRQHQAVVDAACVRHVFNSATLAVALHPAVDAHTFIHADGALDVVEILDVVGDGRRGGNRAGRDRWAVGECRGGSGTLEIVRLAREVATGTD
jgi:hypothetical protein